MRIIFMGTPEFAVASLDILVKGGYSVVAVVTAADKPAGRGQKIQESPVKKYARENHIKVLQPEKLKDEDFLETLRVLKADLQLVVAFRMLPEVVWDMPRLGTYNLHASLLPKYRGAAPINWAIINGEKETGVTTFRLKHEIDTGNILFREKVPIGERTTAGELHDRLMNVGARTLLKTVQAIEGSERGEKLNFSEQDNSQACQAPKIFKTMCRINWNQPLAEIYNFIRGLSPHPAAFTELYNKGGALVIRIFYAERVDEDHAQANGSLHTDNRTYLHVYCRGGYLAVQELQLQGKKRMQIADFLKGFKFAEGDKLN
jgi:methionyl-tRNA formyltransferase